MILVGDIDMMLISGMPNVGLGLRSSLWGSKDLYSSS